MGQMPPNVTEAACLRKESVYGRAKPPPNEIGCAIAEGGTATMRVCQSPASSCEMCCQCAELLLEWVFERIDHYRGSLFNRFELKIPQKYNVVH